jgi:hypothetical protein
MSHLAIPIEAPLLNIEPNITDLIQVHLNPVIFVVITGLSAVHVIASLHVIFVNSCLFWQVVLAAEILVVNWEAVQCMVWGER